MPVIIQKKNVNKSSKDYNVDTEIKQIINNRNELDYKLYNEYLDKLIENTNIQKITFSNPKPSTKLILSMKRIKNRFL